MNNPIKGIDPAVLSKLEPLSSLLDEQLQELAQETGEHALPAGRMLFKAGEVDSYLVYLIEGEVEIQPTQGENFIIKSGTPDSLHPLSEHNPRRCTAIAKTPVLYVRIDDQLLDTMLTWAQSANPDSEEVIMSGDNIVTIDTSRLKNKMQHSPNFRKLPAANIDKLLEKMEPVQVDAGTVIIRQGEEGDYFYVIEKGEALVTRIIDEDEEYTEGSVEMAHLSEGSTFGEAALISDIPRNATVSMQTDGVLLRLNKENFLTLMQEPMQKWITYAEAKQQIDSGAAWIDVRAPGEYHHGHLPGAINIPLNEAHRRAKELKQNTPYICYCQTGRRSSATAFILSQYGLDVSVLKGGLPAIEEDITLDAEAG